MTNEEAIIDIRENIQPIIGGKSLDIAISALEKQIPKKPFLYSFSESHDTYTYFKCPNLCDTFCEVKNNMNFCPKCGQALDWNDHPTEKGGAEE